MEDLTCEDCANGGGAYSLACLDCCRRLYRNAAPHHRASVMAHLRQYGSDEVKSAIATTKSGTGTASTGGMREP